MTAEELERRLKSGEVPVILDVRSGLEFKAGHIRGATHAPLGNVLKVAQSVSKNCEELLLLVCEHGPRAQIAKVRLKWNGYKNIELLKGHMSHWRHSKCVVTREE